MKALKKVLQNGVKFSKYLPKVAASFHLHLFLHVLDCFDAAALVLLFWDKKGDGGGSVTSPLRLPPMDFDTYENYSQSEDPNNNHISIQSRGKIANTSHHRFALGCASNLPITLNDGNIHSVTIVYDCINHSCIVELNGQVILQISIELSSLLECDKAFIGFTAGTGGLTQTHNIISWKVMRPKSDK